MEWTCDSSYSAFQTKSGSALDDGKYDTFYGLSENNCSYSQFWIFPFSELTVPKHYLLVYTVMPYRGKYSQSKHVAVSFLYSLQQYTCMLAYVTHVWFLNFAVRRWL